MLHALISLSSFLFPFIVEASCPTSQCKAEAVTSVSWAQSLNTLQEKALKSHGQEAQALIEQIEAKAETYKSCPTLQALAKQSDRISRSAMNASSSKSQEERYPQKRYPRLLVFVSFSMPNETLKALAQEARQYGGKLILRGLVKGSFKETQKAMQKLDEDALIDPTLFKAYQVKSVPTFVLLEKSPQEATEVVAHDKLTGNVSLKYALEQFTGKGEIKAARNLLQKGRKAL